MSIRDLLSRAGRWNQALLVALLVYALLWPLESWMGWVGGFRAVLLAAAYLLAFVTLVRAAARSSEGLLRRFLWRVRHRMMVVYVFVGLIPVALAISLAGLGSYLIIGPLASYMVTSSIERRAADLHAAAASLGWELRTPGRSPGDEEVQASLEDARGRFPGLIARLETPSGPAQLPASAGTPAPPPGINGYRGAAEIGGRLMLAANAQHASEPFSVLLLAPLTEEYLNRLLPGFGSVMPRGGGMGAAWRRRVARLLPPPQHPLDYAVPWPATVPALSWETGESGLRRKLVLVTRPSAVWRLLLSSQSPQVTARVRRLAIVLIALFGAAMLVSLFIAVWLTRTLTQAVHELHLGTQRLHGGDLAYRIPIRGQDQLGELASSFNRMSASIESLIEESKERQRLQSELEIAREVQQQLFPKTAPALRSIEVVGVCRAARLVSGDFYDYVEISPERLALAFGDVSGKGISAALVMATLHSLVRTHLSLLAAAGQNDEVLRSTAELVAKINEQLHVSTSAEKFSTLFFGTYDEHSATLTYSNAGHLPPLLIRHGEVARLEVNGMVLGAFPQAPYDSSRLEMCPGDLLVAFTDGVTEPENDYGEEFGEERLIDTLLRESGQPTEEIIETVMREVEEWTGSPFLQDDMTMLVMRRP